MNADTKYLAYMYIADPTEYRFAIQEMQSWANWEQFCSQNTQMVEQWRRELKAKIRSESLERILFLAKSAEGSRDTLQANKYLLEADLFTEDNKVGRPTKEAILREATKMKDLDKLKEEDFNRLFNKDSK